MILTAKHHDGFCLWPSRLSTHTVARSPWQGGTGDVLRELSDACREAGLKFGVYLSPWDRNHPAYGTPEYNRVFVGMLEEVLGGYGPIFEVWFDGANGEGPNGKRQVYDWPAFHATVKRLQPEAVIFSDGGPGVRWVGNERGQGSADLLVAARSRPLCARHPVQRRSRRRIAAGRRLGAARMRCLDSSRLVLPCLRETRA